MVHYALLAIARSLKVTRMTSRHLRAFTVLKVIKGHRLKPVFIEPVTSLCHCVSQVCAVIAVMNYIFRQPSVIPLVVLLGHFVVALFNIVNFEIGPAPLATKKFSDNYGIFVRATNECCLAIGRIREAIFW